MISQHFFAFFRNWDSHRLDERELNTSKHPPPAPSRSGPQKELEENHRQPGRLRKGVLSAKMSEGDVAKPHVEDRAHAETRETTKNANTQYATKSNSHLHCIFPAPPYLFYEL